MATRDRKKTGHRINVIYWYFQFKQGCVEASKNAASNQDNKYMDDGMFKQVKSLKGMFCVLLEECPKPNELYTVGFLIMGPAIEAVMCDIPAGYYVSRISRTPSYTYPQSIEMLDNIIIIFDLVWKVKAALEACVELINSKEKKTVDFSSFERVSIPSSFNSEK